MAPRPPQGAVNQNDNGRGAQGWSHPQAKPAPPVQQRNAAQARDDENKFRNWQQQRQQAAPAQNRAPQEHPQEQRQPQRQQENRPKPQKLIRLQSDRNCQSPNRGLAIFLCCPPNHRPHDRLLRTGNLKLGTGFLCKSASYSSAFSKTWPARRATHSAFPKMPRWEMFSATTSKSSRG